MSMTPTTETTVGIGGAAESTDMVLNIGPQHPSTHGVLRLRLVLDGERIRHAEPVIGYMHRGAEKLFEARDYRQIIMLANRHDWLSAFSNELGVVLAVERMLGMEVPERAVWTRTLLAELNRVLNHLMFLGLVPAGARAASRRSSTRSGSARCSRTSWRRSPAAGCTTCSTGSAASRRTCRPAGPAARGPPSPPCARAWTSSTTWCSATRSSAAAPAGVGVLAPEAVHAYGVSGPIARASGVDFDLRRDEPYLAYGELQDTLKVVTRERGRLPGPLRVPAGADPQRPRPRGRLPGPARRAAAGADQPAAARRSSRRPRATRTPGPRTRSASTATTWSARARRPRTG